ncbi:MAG: tape measure protein [Methanothrix sp.]|nr:tape measure protein [Methanothrix sp.]
MALGTVGVTAVIDGMSTFQSNANKFTSTIGKMAGSVGSVGSALFPVGKVLSFFGTQIDRVLTIAGGILVSRIAYKIVDSFAEIGTSAIQATADMQMYEIGISGLIARQLVLEQSNGNLAESVVSVSDVMPQAIKMTDALMDKLATLAIESPYSFEKVVETFRQAMAFKFPAAEAEVFTRSVLTMGAGLGSTNEQLERIGYNLAQVRSQNKVTALDVRQLALAGVDLNDILIYTAKTMGFSIKSYEEFNKLLAEGKITWADFTKAFGEYSDKVFGGAAKRMSLSLEGLKSTFADAFILTIPKLLQGVIEKITAFGGRFVTVLQDIRSSKILEELGAKLTENFQIPPVAERLISWLEQYSSSLKKLSEYKLAGNTQGIEEMGKALESLAPGGRVLEGLIQSVFGEAGLKAFQTFQTVVGITVKVVGALFKALGQTITGDFFGALETLHVPKVVIAFLHDIETALGNLKIFWDQNGQGILDIFTNLYTQATKTPTSGQTGLGGFFINLTQSMIDNGPKIQDTIRNIADWILNTALPALGKFSDWFLNVGLPAIGGFFDWLNTNWETILKVAAAVLVLSGVLQTVGTIIGTLLTLAPAIAQVVESIVGAGGIAAAGAILSQTFAPLLSLLPIFGWIALAIFGIVTAITLLGVAFATNFAGFRDKVLALWDVIVAVLQPAFDQLRVAWDQLAVALQPLIEMFQAYLLPVLKVIGTVLLGVLVGALLTVIGVITGFVRGIITAITFVIQGLATLATGWSQTFEGIKLIIEGFGKFFQGIWAVIQGDWNTAARLFNESFSKHWEGIWKIIQGTWNQIVGIVQISIGSILGLIGGFIGGVIQFFTTLADKLVGHSIIPDMMKDIVTSITTGLTNALTEALKFVGKFLQFGKDLIQSVIDGIKNMASTLISTISSTLANAVQAAKDALQMHSPSKPFLDMGEGIMKSVQKGVENLAHLPEVSVTAALTRTLVASQQLSSPALPIPSISNYSTSNSYVVNATYPYQSERRVSDDIRLLQLMGSV